jgi:hypothetical protein
VMKLLSFSLLISLLSFTMFFIAPNRLDRFVFPWFNSVGYAALLAVGVIVVGFDVSLFESSFM